LKVSVERLKSLNETKKKERKLTPKLGAAHQTKLIETIIKNIIIIIILLINTGMTWKGWKGESDEMGRLDSCLGIGT